MPLTFYWLCLKRETRKCEKTTMLTYGDSCLRYGQRNCLLKNCYFFTLSLHLNCSEIICIWFELLIVNAMLVLTLHSNVYAMICFFSYNALYFYLGNIIAFLSTDTALRVLSPFSDNVNFVQYRFSMCSARVLYVFVLFQKFLSQVSVLLLCLLNCKHSLQLF